MVSNSDFEGLFVSCPMPEAPSFRLKLTEASVSGEEPKLRESLFRPSFLVCGTVLPFYATTAEIPVSKVVSTE